jgi:hypothetical protein
VRSRVAWHLVLSLACFGLEAQAASSDPLTLEWIAPETCSDGETVRREVLRLAEHDGAGSHRVNARVHIQRLGEQVFELRLSAELDGVAGERAFRGRSCGSVTDAAVLTLALMLNPDAEAMSAEPAPTSQVGSAPGQPRAPREHMPSEVDTEPPWPLSGAAALAVGIRTGVLPDPGLEVAIAAGAGLGPLRGWLSASAMPSQTAAISGSTAGGRMWVLSGSALVGWSLNAGMFEAGPLLGAELTRVAGRGSGVSAPERASIRWVSATLGVTGHWRVSAPLALGGGVFGLVPLARPRFYLEGLGPVLEPQMAGIRAHFSAVWLPL